MSVPSTVLIGLPSDHDLIPDNMKERIAKSIKDVGDRLVSAGLEHEFIGVTPEEGVAGLGAKLQARNPDVVVIGNGIRREMNLTPFMEQIVNCIHESVPKAKVGFNTMPDTTYDAVIRNLPAAVTAKLKA